MTQPDYRTPAPVDTSKMSGIQKILWALTHSAPITTPVVDAAANAPQAAQVAGALEGQQNDPMPAEVDASKLTPFQAGQALESGITAPFRTVGGAVDMSGQVLKDAVGRPIGNFIAGATGGKEDTGPTFGSRAAVGDPSIANAPPALSSPDAAAPNPGQDMFGRLMDMLHGAFKADESAKVATTLSGGVAGTPMFQPTKPSDRETQARSNLDQMIQVLAKQSTLPEETFKERLSHVLVGMAVGYNNAYDSGHNSIGTALSGAFAGGAVAGQRYADQVARDRTRAENTNRLATLEAAKLEMGAAGQESVDRHAADREALLQQQINAQDRATAARYAQIAARHSDPMARISFALKSLDLYKKLKDMSTISPYDEAKIPLPNGPVLFKQLPRELKGPALAGLTASFKDPITYARFQAAVTAEATKNGTLDQIRQSGQPGSVEKYIEEKTLQGLVLYYQNHPEAQPRVDVQNGQLPSQP